MVRRTGLVVGVVLVACVVSGTAQVAEELDEYGGQVGVRRAATGFFRTTRAEGRWWLVDPRGSLFISVGVNRVSLRPRGLPGESAAPYREAALARYRNEAEWSKAAVERLRGWGFNTVGAGSDRMTHAREMAYTVGLRCAEALPLREEQSFPDVFDPAYERAVRRHASATCRPYASERWLLGYFTDGELAWGREGEGAGTLLAQFLGLDDEAPGRRALLGFLANRHLNIGELNRTWGAGYASFQEVGRTPQVGSHIPREDVDAFQREVARRYFRVVDDAIRAVDRYHLILGPRFDGEVPRPVLEAMGEHVDVLSLNCRGKALPAKHLREIHRVTELSVIISEFGFRAGERGRSAGGEEVVTQEERAELYRRFVQELMALPMVVGYHWYEHADESAGEGAGRASSGFGLVSVGDEPYGALVEAARRVNAEVYRLAAVEEPTGEGG
ncbi:MAG TPA: hypothetical protein VMY87_10775 [Armatimonadota bacterium]|nr:hypothetical protein [Armatimonadota bacterium]